MGDLFYEDIDKVCGVGDEGVKLLGTVGVEGGSKVLVMMMVMLVMVKVIVIVTMVVVMVMLMMMRESNSSGQSE